ncbi:hypothetical protein EVA23_02420 [bacterium]|nr:MAG: hypothetical protein EVA23_02420 [bacterium]
MANEGHYQRVGGTRQGIYVCSPNGILLNSINSLNPDDVLKMIEDGLEMWNSLPVSDRNIPSNSIPEARHRWENSYPENGMVLNLSKIDLFTDPPIQSERSERWNRDYVWFDNQETRLWLPENPNIGDIYNLPEILLNRLFCFHLVDNTRGQTLPFAPQEIKESKIEIEIQDIRNSLIEIKITGNSMAVSKGPWLLGENDWTPSYELDHGMSTNLLGYASYNVELNKFTKFEMVSIGKRKGKTQNNGRKNSPDSGYIGFYFTLAKDRRSERIAPAFVDVYNADWIVQP